MRTQEDVEDVAFPRIVVCLYMLQIGHLSVEWDYKSNLKVTPLPEDEDIADRVFEHFDELKSLQPGHCDECGEWFIKRVKAYWGPRPMFCVPCWKLRLHRYQRTNEWPSIDLDLDGI